MEERAQLFQYAAIYNPTKEERENGAKAEVILEPKTVLAKSEQVAGMMAVREIPEKWAEKLDNIDVVIRPF